MRTISIVTPSYNQGKFLEQTIDSILSQNYPKLEYIIIDGGSNDNSIEIIKKYEKHLKFWVSEKDKGQANAINKGLAYCTNEIFNWVNSDDFLEEGALKKINDAFSDDSIEVVAGKVNKFTETKSSIGNNVRLSAIDLMCWNKGVDYVQPGVWLKRENIASCGGINEAYHYAFDWDMMIRYLYQFPQVAYIDDLLVHFRIHEESKTGSSLEKFDREEREIIKALLNNPQYSGLHKAAAYKTKRSDWVAFLDETVRNEQLNSIQKIKTILKNIQRQPMDMAVTRMTLGTLKKFF